MLGQALAQQIANEITDVIGHNVLITDESGIVMGSGDESRVGQFHEASVEVVRSRRMIAHSSEDVRDLVGTLPGVTIPLIIDDKVVGTIGLSGSPEEVVQFGLVVKRQTEILMQEAARIGTRMTHERATAELLREICEWHHSGAAKAQLMRRGRTLGHDLTSAPPDRADPVGATVTTGPMPTRSSVRSKRCSTRRTTSSRHWPEWWSRWRHPTRTNARHGSLPRTGRVRAGAWLECSRRDRFHRIRDRRIERLFT